MTNSYGRLTRPEIGGLDQVGFTVLGWTAPDYDTAAQAGEGGLRDETFHLHPIGPRMSEARICDPMLKGSVIGQQHEAFAIEIEPSYGVDVAHGNEIGESFSFG